MDKRVFERPDVAPLLVRLYDSHRLYTLASDDTPQARAELTGAVSALLEKDLTPREHELISDVLISLMRQAERDLRQALAERLATLDTAPLRVILFMADDEIDVARPILKHSPVLSDLDLLYIIKGKTAAYWCEIAHRAGLSGPVVNALADTRDPCTVQALAENRQSPLPAHAADILGALAEKNMSLAGPLLLRHDLPEAVVRRLYQHAGEELRGMIRRNFGTLMPDVTAAIDDVLSEFSGDARNRAFMPTPAMLDSAARLGQSGRLTPAMLLEPLSRGQFGSFIALFARFAGLAPFDVHDMLINPSGRALAMTCRALDLSRGELSRIYMLTQRLRSEDRLVDHHELLRTLAVYDAVSVEKARAAMGMREV